MTVPMTPGQAIKSSELKGLAGISNLSEYVTLSTAYQTLAAAPATGVKRVNQVTLKNTDSGDTADFYLKLVISATDYAVIMISLAPGERFILNYPWILDGNSSLEVKTGAACDGVAIANSVTWVGGMGVLNFAGDTFADLVTVPTGKSYEMLGMIVVNTAVSTQNITVQIIDGAAAVKWSDARALAPGAAWVLGYTPVMSAGWKLQVKHGAASLTGSAVVSYLEVPA